MASIISEQMVKFAFEHHRESEEKDFDYGV